MLPNTQDMIQMCSFDATKSTRGASKLRRDLINAEIANLRDLLPLPSSTRQRLSQLQLMALVCVYVRKANYFQQVFRKCDVNDTMTPNFGFSKAMSGFLMMMTQNGKLLYISDNAAEYLGHSMEDLLIHGDSVYDIIDKQDHQAVQSELMRGSLGPTPPSDASGYNTTSASNGGGNGNVDDEDERFFLCRMNVSRNARRQMRFGDQKVVLMQGHFLSFLPLCSRNEPVFLATCTPVAMPETRECVVQGSTNIFTSIHTMDMKFVHIDKNGEFHLGYAKEEIQGTSWYQLIHSESIREAQSKHRMITQTDQDRACILLLRLQAQSGYWLWLHVVLQVKDNMEGSQHPVIVCTNQVLSERAASVMRANSWLYHYYTVQSKLQYSLALQESQAAASATRASQAAPTYYHHQPPMGYPPAPPPPPPQPPPPGGHPHHLHHLTAPEVPLHHHPHLLHHHHGGGSHHHHHHHHHLLDLNHRHQASVPVPPPPPSSSNDSDSATYSAAAFGSAYHQYANQSTGSEASHTRSPPKMTSLSDWMTTTTTSDSNNAVQPDWLQRRLPVSSAARMTSSLSASLTTTTTTSPSEACVNTDDSSSSSLVGSSRHCRAGTVQMLSSSSVHPMQSSTRAKYERKVRQLDGRSMAIHREEHCLQEDAAAASMHCVPSPTDPQTVPDVTSTVIHGTGLNVVGPRTQLQLGLQEQYVPEMIPMADLYAWNSSHHQHHHHRMSPEVGNFGKHHHLYAHHHHLHHHQAALTATSDGETVSLHTSPSPTYSLGSPSDFAVPHTPEAWPFTATPTTMHFIDGPPPSSTTGKNMVAAARKRLKVSRAFKDVHQAVHQQAPPSRIAVAATATTYGTSGAVHNSKPKCTCHVDTCAPRCPCLRAASSSSPAMTSSSTSAGRTQCCTVAQLTDGHVTRDADKLFNRRN